jgi:hypothetical protein
MLPLLDRGDKLPLPHPPRPRDAKLLRDPLQIRDEQLGKVASRAARCPRRGGSLGAGGRMTDGGVLGRGGRAVEDFGGVAH